MKESKLIEIFCIADDFCIEFIQVFETRLVSSGAVKRKRARSLDMSEIMSLVIFYHQSRFRNFMHYYCHFAKVYLPTIGWFNTCQTHSFLYAVFFDGCCLDKATGKQLVDSCPLVVCHNRRIHNHKTFKGIAKRGKTSVGWFFGFNLHLIINAIGQIVSYFITPESVSDKNWKLMFKLSKGVWGKRFSDKGYFISFKRICLRGSQSTSQIWIPIFIRYRARIFELTQGSYPKLTLNRTRIQLIQ